MSEKQRIRARKNIGRAVLLGARRGRARVGTFARFGFPQGIATRRRFTPRGVVRATIRRLIR